MTTVSPPPPPPPPAGGSQPANTATLVTPSADIANLARGTSIEGVVLATLAKNQLQVQTVFGTIALQTTVKVPPNSVITLTLSQLQPQPVLQVSGLNGAPFPGTNISQSANPASTQASMQNAGQPASPSVTATATSPTLSVGVTTSATLLRPATATTLPAPISGAHAQSASAKVQPQITGGQNQNASVANTTQTTPTQTAQSQTATQATPTQTAQSQTTPQGQTVTPNTTSPLSNAPAGAPNAGGAASAGAVKAGSAPESISMPSGTKFSANVIKIEAPLSSSLTPAAGPRGSVLSLARGAVMTGVVTGTTASNQPIIQLPSATIALDVRGNATVGSKITIEVSGDVRIPRQTGAADAMMRVGMGEQFIKSSSWDSLNEALRVIQAAEPNRFQHLIHTAIPQTGNKLSSQILFFLSALRGGDLKNWLGDSTVRLIERERPNLLSRLGGEFQAMAKLADEPNSGDWRMAMIPIYNNEKIERIRLYQRQPKDKKEKERDGKRFILDLNLSNIGHLQVDGLVKPDGSRVDLIIRSEKPLGQTAQMEITQIYNEAAELTGIGGGVAFQASPGNFVEFPPMAVENNRDSIIV